MSAAKTKTFIINFILILMFSGCTVKTNQLTASPYLDRNQIEIESEFMGLLENNGDYKLSFTIKNNTGKEILFGTQWYLEVLKEECWYTIDYKKKDFLEWDMYAIILEADEHEDLIIPMSSYYDMPLPAGTYRIVQPIYGKLFTLEFSL